MYGHPCLVEAQARAFAPSRAAFWRWWKGSGVQRDLFGVSAMGILPIAGVPEPEPTASNTTPFSLNLRLRDSLAPEQGVGNGER